MHLPLIERPDFEKPKAIEYFSALADSINANSRPQQPKDSIQSSIDHHLKESKKRANKDSLFESTTHFDKGNSSTQMPGTRAADGERELTTGWQFATQIEDDDEDGVD